MPEFLELSLSSISWMITRFLPLETNFHALAPSLCGISSEEFCDDSSSTLTQPRRLTGCRFRPQPSMNWRFCPSCTSPRLYSYELVYILEVCLPEIEDDCYDSASLKLCISNYSGFGFCSMSFLFLDYFLCYIVFCYSVFIKIVNNI